MLMGSMLWLRMCCGVVEFGNFHNVPDDRAASSLDALATIHPNGTGLSTAAFVNTPECKEAYDLLCSRYKLEYQSKPLHNRNSGRKLFFCVFSPKKGKK